MVVTARGRKRGEKKKKKRYVEVEASVWTEIGGSVHVGGVDRFNSVRPGQVVG